DADLRAHHRRAYGARNMVLACAGRVTHARVLGLATRYFGTLSPGRRMRDVPPPPLAHGPTLCAVGHEHSPQTAVRLNFRGPPEDPPEFFALSVARRVLDDGLSSRLPSELVERRGLAYDVRAELDPFSDVSVVELEVATSHENVSAAVATVGGLVGDLV